MKMQVVPIDSTRTRIKYRKVNTDDVEAPPSDYSDDNDSDVNDNVSDNNTVAEEDSFLKSSQPQRKSRRKLCCCCCCRRCCQFCFLLTCIFFVYAYFNPVVVTDVHYHIGAAVRSQKDINTLVNETLRAVLKRVDEFGNEQDGAHPLEIKRFETLAANHSYHELAVESIKGLHQLYPVNQHRSWFHGVYDAWATWAIIIMSCSVVRCSEMPYDLEKNNLRSTLTWRGLSGSDDILWATLAMNQYPHFHNLNYRLNGARGAIQLYDEVEDHYVLHTNQNTTSLYWSTNKQYQSTISLTLFITASCELYNRVGSERYLKNALSTFETLEETKLIEDGYVYDGINSKSVVSQRLWTYNSGMALGAFTELYRATSRSSFLKQAEEIAKRAIVTFWDIHLGERDVPSLNLDQFTFKGLFLHYLSSFLKEMKRVGFVTEDNWIQSLKEKVENEVQFLIQKRLSGKGFCAYWGEAPAEFKCEEAQSYKPQGMCTASQLFVLADVLRKLF
eukprot:g5376.t1